MVGLLDDVAAVDSGVVLGSAELNVELAAGLVGVVSGETDGALAVVEQPPNTNAEPARAAPNLVLLSIRKLPTVLA